MVIDMSVLAQKDIQSSLRFKAKKRVNIRLMRLPSLHFVTSASGSNNVVACVRAEVGRRSWCRALCSYIYKIAADA
jgi:hypothetical protein